MRWEHRTRSPDGWWWAWHPVRIYGTETRVWGERVYRRWIGACDQGFYTYHFEKPRRGPAMSNESKDQS